MADGVAVRRVRMESSTSNSARSIIVARQHMCLSLPGISGGRSVGTVRSSSVRQSASDRALIKLTAPNLSRRAVLFPTGKGQVRCSRALPAWQVAEASAQAVLPRGLEALLNPVVLGILAVLALAIAWIRKVLDTPSRKYNYEQPNVGAEYDAWTLEGVLEHYWGEHIHLGYYSEEERRRGYLKKDFKSAKYDFVYEMLKFADVKNPKRILDVGCGFGGASRMLAKQFPDAEVQGITLSQQQVYRASQMAAVAEIPNVFFRTMDALAMEFKDKVFDLVWACESGEHMPDKKKYIESMTRVLKPGGTMVVATWCQREETADHPLSEKDKKDLQFLYDEWAHPYFISIEEYKRIIEATGEFEEVEIADWTPQTLPSWHHSIWVGVWDPWIVVFKPHIWLKIAREWVMIERMHRAFSRGLMVYGMARAVKKAQPPNLAERAAVEVPTPVPAVPVAA